MYCHCTKGGGERKRKKDYTHPALRVDETTMLSKELDEG
jgi:hypothetical protein